MTSLTKFIYIAITATIAWAFFIEGKDGLIVAALFAFALAGYDVVKQLRNGGA